MWSTYPSTQKKTNWVSKFCISYEAFFLSATTLHHAKLEEVYIYFDTATYDEIERDEKVT